MKINSFRDLEVWKIGMDLVDKVYILTRTFPDTERFGLISQMRRSAVSIVSNIAEGSGRTHTKELIQFLYTSRGSLAELETQLEIAIRQKFCDQAVYDDVLGLIRRVGQMSARLIASLSKP